VNLSDPTTIPTVLGHYIRRAVYKKTKIEYSLDTINLDKDGAPFWVNYEEPVKDGDKYLEFILEALAGEFKTINAKNKRSFPPLDMPCILVLDGKCPCIGKLSEVITEYYYDEYCKKLLWIDYDGNDITQELLSGDKYILLEIEV
jgi:hypothetical protein